MWWLLLGLLGHAGEPFDPLDPFSGKPPVTTVDPAVADPVLDELDADVATWTAQAEVAATALRQALAAWLTESGRGERVSRRATALAVVLQVLSARERLARARLIQAEVALDPPRATRLLAASKQISDTVGTHLEPLVAARLRWVDGAVKRGDLEVALTEGQALVADLEELQRVTGPEPRIDEARLTLIRLAVAVGHPSRAAAWAEACERWCTPEARPAAAELAATAATRVAGQTGEGIDPLSDLGDGTPITGDGPAPAPVEPPDETRHRAWLGVGVVVPAGVGRFEGAEVRRRASGAVDVAWAPSELGCVALRAAVDRWHVPGDATPMTADRVRVELGWCPWIASWTPGRVTIGLRPVGGLGVSTGRFVDSDVEERIKGVGAHVRLEAPIVLGAVAIVPALGAAPYGRATKWDLSTRAPLFFVDRVYATIGVEVGLP